MKCGKVYITCIQDCDENEGGYYCQVYTDEELAEEVDYFCIHIDDCDCNNQEEVENFIRQYSKMYQ